MKSHFLREFAIVFLATSVLAVCFAQFSQSERSISHLETIAILPFELHGLSHEDGSLLANRFAEVVRESNRFEVVSKDNIEGRVDVSDPRSLAQTGKDLAVRKIVHVSIVHRDKLYVLSIRVVNVNDAALLYAERVDYSGEFGSLLSEVIPEQAHKLTQAHLDAEPPWAIAALLFTASLGAILWIFWHFRRNKSTQAQL